MDGPVIPMTPWNRTFGDCFSPGYVLDRLWAAERVFVRKALQESVRSPLLPIAASHPTDLVAATSLLLPALQCNGRRPQRTCPRLATTRS